MIRIRSAAEPALMVALRGAAALALAMGIGRFAFTPLLPPMQAAEGFGADLAGLIASANYLGYLVGALLSAAGTGRVGSRRALFRAALAASVATTAAMAAAPGPGAWILVRFLSGVASAGVLTVGVGLVLEALARRRRADLAGVLFGGVGIGICLSGAVVSEMSDALGWRLDWLVLAALALGLAACCWNMGEDGAAGPGVRPAVAAGSWPLRLLTAAYFAEGMGYVVTGTFLVALLKADPALAGLGDAAWIVTGAAGIPSCLVWAAVARRIGDPAALVLALVAQAVGVVLPVVASGAAAVLLSAILFGGTFMGITLLILGYGRQLAGAASSRAIATLTAGFALGQILGPLWAGALASRSGSYDSALLLSGATVALAAVLVGWAAQAQARRQG